MSDSSQNSNTAQQQQQQTQGTTNPWTPTQPLLDQIISGIGGNSTAPTWAQKSAVSGLGSAAAGIPNLAPQLESAIGSINGVPNTTFDAYQKLQSNLAPISDPNNLNPLNTPGFKDALDYAQQQAKNAIAGQFAGGGRSLSPADVTAQAYGMMGATAPVIASQYNANVGNALNANNATYSAGSNAANTALNAWTGGAGMLGNIPGLAMAGPEAQLQAAQTKFGLPFSNLGTALGLTLPIAGLGGQTQGTGSGTQTGNTNTTYNPSWLASIMSPLALGGNSIGGGLFSSGMNTLGKIV